MQLLRRENITSQVESDKTEILSENQAENRSFTIDNSKNNIDVRADIYSVGATVYHIMSGIRPTRDYNQTVSLDKLCPNISESFRHVIKKAMSVKPEDRYQTSEDMLLAMRNYTKTEKRYKALIYKQYAFYMVLLLGIVGCIILTITGKNKMLEENYRENKEEQQFNETYNQCLQINNTDAAVYCEKALYLYENRQYEESIKYIQSTPLNVHELFEQAGIADIYFILGNCYFEQGDMNNAVSAFADAIKYNYANPQYYRDYAIALSCNGDNDKAKQILEQAVSLGLGEDEIFLAEGEISKEDGDFQEAIVFFQKCIDETQNDYTKMRAYILQSKIYDEQDKTEENLLKNIELLEKAKANLKYENRTLVLERLAQAYIDMASVSENLDFNYKAIDVFNEIIQNGWDSNITYNNIAILYQQLGELETAQTTVFSMLEKYGDSYVAYKRLAFIELESQDGKANSERNYSQFQSYYSEAEELYQNSMNYNQTDTEMQLLNNAYMQLKDGGWL